MNVNGSLRDFKLDTQDWIGVDLEEGNGVDKVLESPYEFPFSNDSFDIVLASSVFEHVDFFWALFEEMYRVCSVNGFIY